MAKKSKSESTFHLAMRRLSDVVNTVVLWLWTHWIPFGKVTAIQGDPNLGKTTLACVIAARVTRGKPMPDDEGNVHEPASVIIVTAEDGLGDTIKRRVEAAGGDVERVFAIEGAYSDDPEDIDDLRLDHHVPALEEAIVLHGAKVAIIDPIVSFMGTVNANKEQEVRTIMKDLKKVAERTGCAILVIQHLNKATNAPLKYRSGGSTAIPAACRSVILVGEHPSGSGNSVMASVKANLGPKPISLEFEIVSVGDSSTLNFLGQVTYSAWA